jgi:F1F0 ATPase subunit 2
MALNEVSAGVLAGLAGGALGAFFFGGLWWTVRQGASSPRPALWFSGSLMLRMGIVMTGFYAVAGAHWERLLLCLGGFAVARLVVTRWTRSMEDRHTGPAVEASHAP